MNNLYEVTVTGSFGAKGYSKLGIGKTVELVPEPTNEHDPDAIQVMLDGAPVGYVANSPKTCLEGTTPATRALKLVGDASVAKTVALLIEEVPLAGKAGDQKRFRAKMFFVPKRGAKTKKAVDKKVIYDAKGNSIRAPRNVELRRAIKQAEDAGKPAKFPVVVRRVGTDGLYKYNVYEQGQEQAAAQIEPKAKDPMVEWFDKHDELKGETTGEVVTATSGQGGSIIKVELTYAAEDKDEFLAAIDAAIERGAGQEKDLQHKVQVMKSGNCDAATIKTALAAMEPDIGREGVPNEPEIPFITKGTDLNDALLCFVTNSHLRFTGPKGAGKNTLIQTVCWILNRAMLRVQGNSDTDKLDLLGSPQLEENRTSFRLSEVMTALRDGTVVVIDEANFISPNVLGALHSVTDGARAITVPGYGEVKLAPNSMVVYTWNEGYAGTGELNDGTIDRTGLFEMEPEINLLGILKDYPQDQVAICQKISDQIRKAVTEGKISAECITIRGYITALEYAKVGMPLKRALYRGVVKSQEPAYRTAVRSIIDLNA